MLKFIPGAGFALDAASGEMLLHLAALAGGAGFSVARQSADGTLLARYRVTVVEEPVAASGTVTTFDDAAKLGQLGFVSAAAPSWSQGDGFARLVPATTARAHGDWTGAGGDGRYRCLFRLHGGHPAAIDRRFSFGGRVRLAESDWFGVRVEIFETPGGDRRLHIREYTGASGMTASLATVPAAWDYDTWQWIEVEIDGPAVRGRVYAEGAAAPDWQLAATTRQLEPGAFGPGGFPASGLSPVIDVKRLEFVPAS